MTPKEKAQDLVDKYRNLLMDEDTECGNEILCTSIAIKAAEITVDEAHELLNKLMFQYKESMIWKAESEYWSKVAHELRLL